MSDGAIIHDGEKQLVLSRCLTCGQPRLLELRGDGTCAHDTGCGCVRAFTTYAAASPASAPATHAPPASVFTMPELAYQVMRDFATRCDGRKVKHCKACGFLLMALDEIALLRAQLDSLHTTETTND